MEQRVSNLEADMKVCQVELEIVKAQSKEELQELKDAIKTLKEGFDNINNTINSIRWLVVGAVAMMAISELGIGKLVLKLLGV